MKKRRTKVFLSLLAVLAVGFATANAYTFTVENRNPFGVLNLSKLVVKANPSSDTGMELEGYTLKIATDAGQIRVHEICDETGTPSSCKPVSTLGNGTPNNPTIKITQGGVEKGSFTLNQSTAATIALDAGTANNPTIKITQGGVEKGSFTLNQSTAATIALDAGTANNPTIKITQGGVEKGSFTLNQANAATIALDAGTANNPTIKITQGGVEKGSFTLNQANAATIALDAGTANNPTITISQGGVEKGSFTLNQANAATIDLDAGGGVGIQDFIASSDYYCYALSANKISCNKTISSTQNKTGGSSKWTTDSNSRLKPANDEDLYFVDGTKIRFGGTLTFEDTGTHIGVINLGTQCTYGLSKITIDENGLNVGTNSCFRGGFGINTIGKITAGTAGSCSANTIIMYATGSSTTTEDHYEILGSQRLLVGTNSDAYIYFNNNGKVGINTTNLNSSATLKIDGGIQISSCGLGSCNSANKGQIRYIEISNQGYFVGCKKNGSSSDYKRVKLNESDTWQQESISTTDCQISVPYDINEYTLQAPKQCSL